MPISANLASGRERTRSEQLDSRSQRSGLFEVTRWRREGTSQCALCEAEAARPSQIVAPRPEWNDISAMDERKRIHACAKNRAKCPTCTLPVHRPLTGSSTKRGEAGASAV